ncbi:SDR family NAD(P)-dependent oxidoreductase [Streptomyces sp. NPDC002838]|uniref:SDR family NAD(P)-dependent oxidoreductase n=1 Tax=Streptomyces sp. NPDC002838 TaxID=3154436 RepID=UPI003324C86F
MTGRRRILITGASRGIGRATAKALAARGFDLALWARTERDLADTARELAAGGTNVRTAVVDVGDADAVRRAAAASCADPGGLAGLVLNAGAGVWTPLSDLGPIEWHRTIRTNLDGAFHALTAAMPSLIAGRGLIVGLLSDSVLHPFPERAAYSAAKSGMRALLEVARRELRQNGVRVSLVLPSRVDTSFQGAHREAGPGTRPGALSAADVAQVVAALYETPAHVEIRETHVAATTSTFGPFPERSE